MSLGQSELRLCAVFGGYRNRKSSLQRDYPLYNDCFHPPVPKGGGDDDDDDDYLRGCRRRDITSL